VDFDQLAAMCDKAGEPIKVLARVNPVKWQVSLVSKYDWNGCAVDFGTTPTDALRNAMMQRGHLPRTEAPIPDIDDLI
jgi:hypothetical protein